MKDGIHIDDSKRAYVWYLDGKLMGECSVDAPQEVVTAWMSEILCPRPVPPFVVCGQDVGKDANLAGNLRERLGS